MSELVKIQGERYSFHDQAAELLGVPEAIRASIDTHPHLYELFDAEDDDRAVVAIANTSKGSIGGSYEEVARGVGLVIGKVDLDIVLPLYGISGSTLGDVAFYHTQEHAFHQVRGSLEARHGKDYTKRWVPETDTAKSAWSIKDLHDPTHAAITPHPAGQAAGLDCLVDNMRDNKEFNVTSFYFIAKGRYAEVPEDSTIAVGSLQRVGGVAAIGRLQREVSLGTIQLVHRKDTSKSNLIIEMHSGGDHEGAIKEAQAALDGLYRVSYLGGYAPIGGIGGPDAAPVAH